MYLTWNQIDAIIRAHNLASQKHGDTESMRAALHEAGFVLEGDIINGEAIHEPPPGGTLHTIGRHPALSH